MKKKNLNIFTFSFFNKENIKENQNKFINLTRKEILKKSKYCEKTYNYVLNDLYKKLNELHNEKLSKRAWEIILGEWLRCLIFFLYKNYFNLKFFIKKNRINKINILNKKNQLFEINSTVSSIKKFNEQEFNLIVNSKLAEYFFHTKINFLKDIIFKKKDNFVKRYFFSLVNFKFITNLFYRVLLIKRNFFISDSYLPFFQEKKLEILLGQFPFIYNQPNVNSSIYNLNLRDKIKFKKSKSKNFRNFLEENLKYFIPKTFIEDFKKIKFLSTIYLYPRKPKFIFTSALWAHDDVFKVFTALSVEKKTPYITGQHGNNVFTKITFKNGIEFKTCDYFLSWGYKNNKKIKNFFNFKVLNKNIIRTKKEKLIIVLPYFQELPCDLNSNLYKIVYKLIEFLKNLDKLDPVIKKDIIFRLPIHTNNKFNINYLNLLKNVSAEIDFGEKPLKHLLKNSKLCLFTYDSTGFLENTLLNIPSIILEHDNHLDSIEKKQLIKYKKLATSNLLFTNQKNFINFLNLKWESIDEWWDSKEVKRSINFFNKNLNNKPNDNSLMNLTNFFKKFII